MSQTLDLSFFYLLANKGTRGDGTGTWRHSAGGEQTPERTGSTAGHSPGQPHGVWSLTNGGRTQNIKVRGAASNTLIIWKNRNELG
jgi:hypothetical protein